MQKRSFAAVLALVASAAGPAHASDPSQSAWTRDTGFAMRLLGAGRRSPGVLAAGVQIRLDPGFKTYWRTPGDSGVPPRFDWSGSTNLAAARIRWPAPHAFADGGGRSLGYAGEVIFPVDVVPADPDRPVGLALHLDFAVCEKLCLPAQASARLALDPGAPASPSAVRMVQAFERRVPARTAVGELGPLTIENATTEPPSAAPVLAVTVRAPPGATVELAAEAPEPLAIGVPEPVTADAAGLARFRLDLPKEIFEPAAAHGEVGLTAVSGDRAVEADLSIAGLSRP